MLGHILYPAAIAMSRFLELHSDTLLRDTKGKERASNVLELGAGGGLPGLVAALEGAGHVRPSLSSFPRGFLKAHNVRHCRSSFPISPIQHWSITFKRMLRLILMLLDH